MFSQSFYNPVFQLGHVSVLTPFLEGFLVKGSVKGHAEGFLKCLLLVLGKLFLSMFFLVTAKGIVQSVELLLETHDVVFAQTQLPISTQLIPKEADVAVAAAIAFAP